MSETPQELRYTDTHEWARLDPDGTVCVGISDFAQDALGDVVFIELPETGTEVAAGAEVAVIESVKAASDIYSPISGEVVRVNSDLVEEPDLVNSEPYEGGWIFVVQPLNDDQMADLLTAEQYQEFCESEDHDH
ncbi:MAG: glycine cleavage system protein GcvH [Gammaproteobacteria bacterium]|nr:glycine cleavage system protein GcvH [Gammaproteobacteria bacterium]MYF37334.1 glycine cleavage system protein GcvH [Gammaproteobacteria bacterium]